MSETASRIKRCDSWLPSNFLLVLFLLIFLARHRSIGTEKAYYIFALNRPHVKAGKVHLKEQSTCHELFACKKLDVTSLGVYRRCTGWNNLLVAHSKLEY